jgi:hypothetical protein
MGSPLPRVADILPAHTAQLRSLKSGRRVNAIQACRRDMIDKTGFSCDQSHVVGVTIGQVPSGSVSTEGRQSI